KNGKVFIINMHIAKYDFGNIFNHEETRTRELLLNKSEIRKLLSKTTLDGHTLIPTKVYMKQGLCKIEVCICKGKNLRDKRQTIKERDINRETQKIMKNI
ncbi:MAG: SsrA-binding protein, partial [Anaeroplasmataceae bacterium]